MASSVSAILDSSVALSDYALAEFWTRVPLSAGGWCLSSFAVSDLLAASVGHHQLSSLAGMSDRHTASLQLVGACIAPAAIGRVLGLAHPTDDVLRALMPPLGSALGVAVKRLGSGDVHGVVVFYSLRKEVVSCRVYGKRGGAPTRLHLPPSPPTPPPTPRCAPP